MARLCSLLVLMCALLAPPPMATPSPNHSKGQMLRAFTGALEFDDIAMFDKRTLDGRQIPIVENTDPSGSWEYESPEAPFFLNESGEQIKVLISRENDGPARVQFHNIPDNTRTTWQVLTGTNSVSYTNTYTWPSAGSNLNGGDTVTWVANSRMDSWSMWRSVFPNTGTAVTPSTWGDLRFYCDCLIAQAWNWDIGILPVWYNILDTGSGIERRDSTSPTSQPPGALVHRWIPNDPPGAATPYPRMESNDAQQSYPAQFLVYLDDPDTTEVVETDFIVAGVIFDLPGTKAFYSMVTPMRVFSGAGDEGNFVALNDKVITSVQLSTYVKVDNSGEDDTTDRWGHKILWGPTILQTVGNDPPPLPGPPTRATFTVFSLTAYNPTESPYQWELDFFNQALNAPRCWMFGEQADRQRIAGP